MAATKDPGPALTRDDLLAHVARGEFAAAKRRLEGGDLDEPARAAARAELAYQAEGPLLDLLVGARRAQQEGQPRAGRLLAAAARVLAQAGARQLAAALLPRASKDVDVALARKQLATGVWRGSSPRAFAAHVRAARGDAKGFAAELRSLLADRAEPLPERMSAAVTLAGLALARRDFARSAEWLDQAVALSPTADRVAWLRYQMGLAQVATGDAQSALKSLAGASSPGEACPALAGDASTLACRLEAKAPEAPAWRVCRRGIPQAGSGMRGVVEACAAGFGVASPGAIRDGFSLGPGRAALERAGLCTLRVTLTPAIAVAALEEGAWVVLEEERPTEQGFRFLLAFDPSTELLLLRDPDSLPAELVPLAVQQRKSGLVSMSALLVLGHGRPAAARRARLAERQVEGDPVFAWLDACEADEDSEPPPPAEIRRLAERVLAARPGHPLASKLMGEQLCEDEDQRDEFLAWFATASQTFSRAEWFWQLYARFLDSQNRYPESGIAWAEAARLDPRDARNTFGRAYALAQMGRNAESETFLRQTVELAPDHAAAYSWLAAAALERRDFDTAAAAAELWRALASDDAAGPWVSLANTAEGRGQPEHAQACLAQALRREPDNPRIARRLSWHHAQSGAWARARALLSPFVRHPPAREIADPEARAEVVAAAVRLDWATGQTEAGLALSLAAIEDIGPAPALLAAFVHILTTSLPTPTRERAVLAQLCRRLPHTGEAWGTLLAELCAGQHAREAEQVLAALAVRFKGAPDSALWLRGRTWLQLGHAEQAREALEPLFAKDPAWEAGRAYLALACLPVDARRALDLVKPQSDALLAAQWITALSALESLGETTRAAGLRERLTGLPADLVAGGARLLRTCRRFDLARDLAGLGLGAHPGESALRVEQLRALLGLGEVPLALSVARELVRCAIAVPRFTLEAFIRAHAWDDLAPAARLALARGSDQDEDDGLALRAVLATDELRHGNGKPRRQLLAVGPAHPGVAAMLARLSQALGLATAREDRARLGRVAPGVARRPALGVLR
jgi:tetratricopeptide (TPR) repeat protein